MVVQLVIALQCFPRHVRDVFRHAALVKSHHGARKSRPVHIEIGSALQGGGTEHLRIHRALNGQRLILGCHAVPPCLLAVDALILHHHGMQAGIRIELCQLQQLLFRQRRHRVGCHHRVGGCIHIAVVGLHADIKPQRLGRILFGPVQRGMLKHMRETCIIHRPCFEHKIKGPVGIPILQIHDLGTGFIMFQQNGGGANQRNVPDFPDRKRVNGIPDPGHSLCICTFSHGCTDTKHKANRQTPG